MNRAGVLSAPHPQPLSGERERGEILWREWFAYAVLSLGLSPCDFWALTLFEWRALAPESAGAMDRGGLERLIALYPDERPENGKQES